MKYSTLDFEMELPHQPIVFEVGALYAYLHQIEDKRACRGRLYELEHLLFIALLAKLMGQNQIEAIAHWAKLRVKELARLLNLKREQMPHKTTWGRVFGEAIEVNQFEELIASFFQAQLSPQIPARGSVVINIDGKTLRGTIPAGKTTGVHLMAAYLPSLGVVLAQVAVECKENEIVAAPKVIEQLDLRGLVVTGDAMQTQRHLSVQIVGGGGDYLWFVKDNQPSLLKDVQLLFEPEPVAPGCSPHPEPSDFRRVRHLSKGHGRIEERILTASSWLKEYSGWPHLAQVFKLEQVTTDFSGKLLWKEVRYGITSLDVEVANARRLLTIARSAWGIENKLHWRRDVLLGEDWSQLRRGSGPQVNAILNNLVLGLLALNGQKQIAAARREMEYDPTKALHLLLRAPLSTF